MKSSLVLPGKFSLYNISEVISAGRVAPLVDLLFQIQHTVQGPGIRRVVLDKVGKVFFVL